MSKCPLCLKTDPNFYFQNDKKAYFICDNCHLISAGDEYLLTSEKEVAVYDRHENDPNDQGYINFMERILTPLREIIPKDSCGLDFGCGPGPVVHSILSKEGYNISEYDPYYKKDLNTLNKKYDFVIVTEVFEHIYNTKEDLELILSLVGEKGVLAVMTKFYPDGIDKFRYWGYHQDPTHVRFFNRETFEWIGNQYSLKLIIPRENVAFLIKE